MLEIDPILAKFYENTVYDFSKSLIQQQEERNTAQRGRLRETIIHNFIGVCKNIEEIQAVHTIGEICALYYTQLNMNILNKTFECPVLTFETNVYSRDFVEVGSLNVAAFYEKLLEFWEIVGEKRKRYLDKITKSHIEIMVMKEAQKYHVLLNDFMKDIAIEMIELNDFKKIKLQSPFHLFMGGLYDYHNNLATVQ